jgi:hypothetical protein
MVTQDSLPYSPNKAKTWPYPGAREFMYKIVNLFFF